MSEQRRLSGLHLPRPRKGVRGLVGRPLVLEARAPFEARALKRSTLWHGDGVPPGKGRGALLIPGFMSGTSKADALAHVLREADWEVEVTQVGRNAGPAYHVADAATETLADLTERTGERVTIVGHSRGGQIGRVLAVREPMQVRKVVAIGAPLRTKYPPFLLVKVPAETLDRVWRWGVLGPVDPDREQGVDDHRYLPFPEDVELVSIFSRNDGIVDWRYSFDEYARMVEIRGSHLGMFNSIEGIQAISDHLD